MSNKFFISSLLFLFFFSTIQGQSKEETYSYWRNLGIASHNQTNYEEAINYFQRAQQQEGLPKEHDLFDLLGKAYIAHINQLKGLNEELKTSKSRSDLLLKKAREAEKIAQNVRAEAEANLQKFTQADQRGDRLHHALLALAAAARSLQINDSSIRNYLAVHVYDIYAQTRQDSTQFENVIYHTLHEALLQEYGPRYYSFQQHIGAVNDLLFSDNANTLFSIGSDGNLISWAWSSLHPNPSKEVTTEIWERKLSNTSHLGFSETGKIESRDADFGIPPELKAKLPIHRFSIPGSGNIAFAFVDQQNRPYVFDKQKDEVVPIPWDPSEPIYSLSISPDGNWMAIGDAIGYVSLVNLQEMQPVAKLGGHSARISSLQFSPSGNLLASGSYDGRIQVWDLTVKSTLIAQQLPLVLTQSEWVMNLEFHPSEAYLLGANKNGAIKIWPLKMEIMAKQLYDLRKGELSDSQKEQYVGEVIEIINPISSQ